MKKNIIIIGYKFFGYELEIIEELEKKYQVKFIDISMNFIEKVFLRLVYFFLNKYFFTFEKFLIRKKIKLLKKINSKEEIDILFVLAYSYNLDQIFFSYMKENLKIRKKILYVWDTIRVIKDFENYRKNFDEVYSYDKEEANKYNLKFRPTFYSNRLKKISERTKKNYEISFVGGFTEERYLLIKKYISNFSSSYIYLFMPVTYYLRLFFKFNNETIKISPFLFKREKYNKILADSDIILDLVRFNQTGLTQRIFDALFLGKKIITTSSVIKNYDFYNEDNILILDINTTINDIEKFRKKKYIRVDKKIVENYSIKNWVADIFN